MTRLTPEQIAEIKESLSIPLGHLEHVSDWDLIVQYKTQAKALLSHLESDGWQTMETAPTDGYFLAWSPDHPHLCMPYEAKQFHRMRRDGTPRHLSSNHITHWRPLPAPPETKE